VTIIHEDEIEKYYRVCLTMHSGYARGVLSLKRHQLLLLFLSFTVCCCTQAAPQPSAVYTYDARPLNRLDLADPAQTGRIWDEMHLLSAVQGLVNRDAPQLYLFYCSEFGVDTDQFWFQWLIHEDGWLKSARVHALTNLQDVLIRFRSAYQGLIVYDPAVPATATLASTIAGCDDLLPVRYGTPLFGTLVTDMRLPVKVWLVHTNGTSLFTGAGTIPDTQEASTGSAKNDCYRWAIKHYLAKTQPGIAAYYIDAFWLANPRAADPTMHTLSNHDYFVARKAFFFDLSPWADETPNDDPAQPLGLDRKTFLEVLRALYDHNRGGITKVGGFTPWPFKYTSHASKQSRHDGVPTEWEHARLLSQFNAYMEADAAGLAAMANASFYRHYPLAERYPQPNPKPKPADWRAKGYLDAQGSVTNVLFVGHYVGDYDAPSWLYKAVPALFPNRGQARAPLGWAFNPNLADRAPQALVYAYRNAAGGDFFIAGDSGAGYLNPRALTVRPDSGLPPGLSAWARHCEPYFRRWDMSITGFILDGAAGASTDLEFKAYAGFSPDGAGTHFEPGPAISGGIPTCPERDLPDDVNQALEVFLEYDRNRSDKPAFLWARSILKSRAWYEELSELIAKRGRAERIVVVDPYTFFGLIREHHGRN
jgi:hypothetical protein